VVCRIVEAGDGVRDALDQLRHGGTVLTRHDRVVNIAARHGRLLALHGPDVALTPFGLVVDPVPSAWPAPGTPISRSNTLLAVGSLTVDLATVLLAAPVLPVPAVPPGVTVAGSGDVTMDALSIAHETLAPFVAGSAFGCWWRLTSDDGGALGSALHRRGREAILAMQAALQFGLPDRARIGLAACGLVGLGPGATPAGDDLVLGFLGAWQVFGPCPNDARRVVQAVSHHAEAATTRLAAELYYHLAHGRLSRPVRTLLDASSFGQREDIIVAATDLCGFGATSGRDTIAGIHAYLAARTRDGSLSDRS